MLIGLGIIMGLITLLLGGLAAREAFRSQTLRRTAARAPGRIVAVESYTKGTSRLYTPVFEFQSADGKQHRVTYATGMSPSPYAVGDAVTVLYDPVVPSEARVDAFHNLWLAPLLLAIGAGSSLIFALVCAWGATRPPV